MRLGLFFRVLTLSILAAGIAFGQAQKPDNQPANSSISGQVKLGGAPLANKTVVVVRLENRNNVLMSSDGTPADSIYHSAKTDAEGRYHISGLRAGTYEVKVEAAALAPARKGDPQRQTITLVENEAEENVNFTLARGGIITGRVTDAEGRPLIALRLQLSTRDDGENQRPYGDVSNGEYETDDRGIYRLFGLPAGRYIVGAGGANYGRLGAASKYPMTYFPGVTDEKLARAIEITEGSEITEIDIRLGGAKKGYEAIGRIVDAESGKPISQVSLFCAGFPPSSFIGRVSSDAKGEFRFSGMPPGQYVIQLSSNYDMLFGNQSEHYADEVKLEVIDANVTELLIQAKRGISLSGVVTVEGIPEQKGKINLGQMMIMGIVQRQKAGASDESENRSSSTTDFSRAKLNGDGTFRLMGLPPGKVVGFNLTNLSNGSTPTVIRMEHNGTDISTGVDIRSGETVSGVKVVIASATSSIRGQINFTGGKLPEGWQVMVFARRKNAPEFDRGGGFAEADAKGRFVIDGLVEGEYELLLSAQPRNGGGDLRHTEHSVRIAGGVETPVTITFDLSKKEQEEGQ